MVAIDVGTRSGSASRLAVDVSSIGSSDARQEVRGALGQVVREYDEFERFWSLLARGASREIPSNLLVCGDLSPIVRAYSSTDRHRWIASIRETRAYILAFVRTRSDEGCLDRVDELVRTSDLRVSICRFRERTGDWLGNCVKDAVSALDPATVLDVRHSRADPSLWVEFGDGLSGCIRPGDLGFDDPDELRLETAAIGALPGTVQVLDRTGEVVDIDGGSLRALLDPAHRRRIAHEAAAADRSLGERLREQRVRRGVTQAELASRCGLDQAVISKLERGRHQPRWDTVQRFAHGLGIDPDQLLGL